MARSYPLGLALLVSAFVVASRPWRAPDTVIQTDDLCTSRSWIGNAGSCRCTRPPKAALSKG